MPGEITNQHKSSPSQWENVFLAFPGPAALQWEGRAPGTGCPMAAGSHMGILVAGCFLLAANTSVSASATAWPARACMPALAPAPAAYLLSFRPSE